MLGAVLYGGERDVGNVNHVPPGLPAKTALSGRAQRRPVLESPSLPSNRFFKQFDHVGFGLSLDAAISR